LKERGRKPGDRRGSAENGENQTMPPKMPVSVPVCSVEKLSFSCKKQGKSRESPVVEKGVEDLAEVGDPECRSTRCEFPASVGKAQKCLLMTLWRGPSPRCCDYSARVYLPRRVLTFQPRVRDSESFFCRLAGRRQW